MKKLSLFLMNMTAYFVIIQMKKKRLKSILKSLKRFG